MPAAARVVVSTLPLYEPDTFTRYPVGAAPLTGGSHDALTLEPLLVAETLAGASGALHVPGNVSVTAFDDTLTPLVFVATTENVYVPDGTLAS